MNKKNLALIENLMSDYKTIRDKVARNEKLTDAESFRFDELLAELYDNGAGNEATDELNARRHRAIRPELDSGYQSRGKVFDSFGAQLQAIRNAAEPGQEPDRRLYQVRAATGLSEQIASDGGFLVEQTFSREIFRNAFANAQIAPLCREVNIGDNSNSVKINAVAETSRVSTRWGGIVGYWLSEAGTKVASAPKFRQMELTLKKFVILCYATDELLQDVALLDQTLRQGFADELSLRLDDAVIRGSGAGQPLGILNSPCLASVTRNGAGTIAIQDVANMWGRLIPGAHKNAVWIVNPDCLPTLYQMTVTVGTAGGQAVFLPGGSIAGVPYSTLMGRPLIVSEVASAIGTAGDLILGDFSQYAIISKGTKVDVSMHIRFLNDESVYRGVTRIDGQPLLNATVTPFKGTNALSAFVALTT